MITRSCIVAMVIVGAVAGVADAQVCATSEECIKRCFAGEKEPCVWLTGVADRLCKENKEGGWCGVAATIYAEGLIGEATTRDATSADYWRRGCELDDGDSCGSWGYALMYGQGATKDELAGIAAWKKSCKLRSSLGCKNIGGRLMKGLGVEKDEPAAAEALTFACNQKDKLACNLLGQLYVNGVKGRPDPEKAKAAHQAACELGSSDSCREAKALGGAGGTVDLKAETETYRKACEDEHHLGSCNVYGSRLYDGVGVRRNRKRGLALRVRTCREGFPLGCAELGLAWMNGDGFKQDLKKAAEYLDLGCRQGMPEACHNAGWLHTGLPGAKHDAKRGFAYYEKACASKSAAGCTEVASAYYMGKVVPLDRARAYDLWETACKMGEVVACQNGEEFLEQSDPDRAEWFRAAACKLGHPPPCDASSATRPQTPSP